MNLTCLVGVENTFVPFFHIAVLKILSGIVGCKPLFDHITVKSVLVILYSLQLLGGSLMFGDLKSYIEMARIFFD